MAAPVADSASSGPSEPAASPAPAEAALGGRLGKLLADQRVRFLIVGGINTLVGYLTYAVLFRLLEPHLSHAAAYMTALVGSYVVGMSVAFGLHRRFVFEVSGTGSVLADLWRFVLVNLGTIGLNAVLLPFFVEVVGLNAYVAQAISQLIAAVASYVGHRFFSFDRTRR